MLRKIRLLVLLLFALLAACNQAPAPEAEAPETLAPMFGSTQSDYFGQNGLARHSSGVYAVGQTFGKLYGSNNGGGDIFPASTTPRAP